MTVFSDQQFGRHQRSIPAQRPIAHNGIAVYAFSADPPTLAHIDILRRAANLFERVIWAIGHNVTKQSLLTSQQKQDCCTAICAAEAFDNVLVQSFSGATVDLAREHGARILVRGLRDSQDLSAEYRQAQANTRLASEIETVFLMAQPRYVAFSSSVVRELLTLKKPIEDYVSPEVERLLSTQFSYLRKSVE